MDEQGRTDWGAWEGEMFRLLAENVKDYAIFVVDPHRHILSWSKGAERLLGFTEAEIIGKQCDCFFTPEDVQRGVPQKELEQALATGRGEDDRWHMRKDGTRFWASGAVTPLKDEDGRLRGFAKIMRDRTEMRRAEEAAHERERQLQLLTDKAPVLIAHCGTDRRYKFVNRPFAARFGLHPREVIGKRIEEVLGGKVYAAVEPQIDAALAGERVEFEVEVPYAGLGRQVMRCSYDPEFDAEGRVQGFVAALVNVTEGRQAREALRESEERLRTLSDNLPHGAVYQVLGDREGRRKFSYISAGVERLFGVTPAEAMADANALYGLVHEEDRPRVAAQEEVALRDLAPYDCEFRSWTRTGDLRWFHCRSAPRRLRTGETAWEGIVLDVTDHHRAVREREEALVTLSNLVAAAPVGIALLDAGMRFRLLNGPLAEMNGLPAEEHIGRTVAEVVPEVYSQAEPIFRKVLETGRAVPDEILEGETAKAPGVKRVWRESWFPVARPDGTPFGVGVIVQEITAERRRSEQVRRLAGVATRITADLDVPSIMGVVTEEARVLIGAHQAVTGFTADLSWGQAINAVSLSESYAAWRGYDAKPDGSGIYSLVCRTNRPMRLTQAELEAHPAWRGFSGEAGKHPPLRGWLAAPLVGRDGRNIGLIQLSDKYEGEFTEDDEAVLVQLAQMASVAVENARLVESLRDADRRKDEFLATLAHELRNPLAPLRNGLQVMKLAAGNAEAVEQARSLMERQMAVMVRLIDDLLDVSRITRGKLPLRRERVDLASVVQSAVEGSRPLIETSAHRLTVSLPPEPIYLDADPTRLAQVFANLLTNAAKYTDKAGHIWLTAGRHEGEVVVSVRDTGIGIAAEHLPRLFEMFSQVAPALERSQGGLGIGLSLVKGLVEMHGGRIEARSEGPGKGSEFVVRLPVAGDVPAPETPAPGSGERATARPRRRILLADDNRDAADSLAMMLRLAGHEVHATHDGQEAVEAAEWFRPDVALLDLGMPRMNGFEAARRIREQPWGRSVILVAITGWGQDEDKRRASEAGFDHHLTKPVDPAALEKLLAGLETA